MNDEQIRKDFEEWMGGGGLSLRAIGRNSMGDYILMQTAHAWEVWKAAHTHYAKPAAPVALPEPFGYFKPFVDGWMDCKETDEGARPLYEAPQPLADALDAARYRWLRDQGGLADGSRHPQSWRCVAMLADMGGEHADTAIDAAIAATGTWPSAAQPVEGGEV